MAKNITRKQLQAFIEVVKQQNFALAAKQMYLSQPALSISIKKLEQEIGGALLSRSTRHIELTAEGKVFLPVARRLIRDWDEAFWDMHELFSMQKGKLTVSAMPSFASSKLPLYLADFHHQYTNIKVTVLDQVMELVYESVQEGRAELGFTFEREKMAQVDFIPLFDDKFMAILPVEHPLAGELGLSWAQICECSFIAMNSGSSLRQWCDEQAAAQGLSLSHVVEASQLATVGHMVASGLGISVVPALCQTQMQLPGVIQLPVLDGNLVKRVGVIKRKGALLSTAVEHFLKGIMTR